MDESTADGAKPDVEDVVDAVDPLAGLVEKTAADPGAPFAPEILAAIADLKKADRAAFETLRAGLKRTGCRVTALDDALTEESGSGATNARAQTQTDILLRLAQAADLFHTPDLVCYADLDINGHRETWLIRSKGFNRWLARAFFDETNGAAGSEAMAAALNVIEAKAHYDADERQVHTRVARLDGKLYIDLCDAGWRAIEIDAAGWRVVDTPPVRFRRASRRAPIAGPRARREDRRSQAFSQCPLHPRLRPDRRLGAGRTDRSRPLSGARLRRRAGHQQIDRLKDTADTDRLQIPLPCAPCRATTASCSSRRPTRTCSSSTM